MHKRAIGSEISEPPTHTRAVQWPAGHKLTPVIVPECRQVFLASNNCISWPLLFYSISYKAREQRTKVFTESDSIHLVKGSWSRPVFKQATVMALSFINVMLEKNTYFNSERLFLDLSSSYFSLIIMLSVNITEHHGKLHNINTKLYILIRK